MIKRLHNQGDTIVEVLIVLMVLSSVLSTSYVFANRNFKSVRQSQERTVAVKLAENQLEMLRAEYQTEMAAGTTAQSGKLFDPNTSTTSTVFCMYSLNGQSTMQNNALLLSSTAQTMAAYLAWPQPTLNGANDKIATYDNNCKTINGVTYGAFIVRDGTAPNYRFTVFVRWDSINGTTTLPHDEVNLKYRLDN